MNHARRCALYAMSLIALGSITGCGTAGAQSTAEERSGRSRADASGAAMEVWPPTIKVVGGSTIAFEARIAGEAVPGVRWSVAEAEGGTIDGHGVYVAPRELGTYHVVARSARDPARAATATVTVLARANRMGINLGETYVDYAPERMYANAGHTFRELRTPSGGALVPLDALGFPLASDLRVGVQAGLQHAEGTYGLRIGGWVEDVTVGLGGGTAIPTDAKGREVRSWNAAYVGGFTYGRVRFTFRDGEAFWLYVAGAYRDPEKTRPGFSSFELMRPIAPGAETPLPFGTLFTPDFIALLHRFEAARWMDFLSTAHNEQRQWSDRALPGWASVGDESRQKLTVNGKSKDRGGPWEDVIRASNAAGVDAWINIPLYADDAYVANVARTFKYGSDGTNPYGARQEQPLYPPLDPGLNLYVEYSNEVWNSGGNYDWQRNRDLTTAEVAAYPGRTGPLNYDGASWALDMRRVAKRLVEISNIFRSVFGDGEMPHAGSARIRPILASQTYNPDPTLKVPLLYVFNYWNNGDGKHFGEGGDARCTFPTRPADGQPHPPSYYFYGAGGSTYYNPNDPRGEPANLHPDAARPSIWTANDMDPAIFQGAGHQQENGEIVAAYGLKRIAYEGGPDFPGGNAAVKAAAVSVFRDADHPDPYNMEASFEEHHRVFSRAGGELSAYYRAGGDYKWGFLPIDAEHRSGNVYSLRSPKLRAVATLRSEEPARISIGQAIPGKRQGNGYTITGETYQNGGKNDGPMTLSPAGNPFAAYLFRADAARAPAAITVSVKNSSGLLAVYVDGTLALTTQATGAVVVPAVLPEGLHSVALRALSGKIQVATVAIQ